MKSQLLEISVEQVRSRQDCLNADERQKLKIKLVIDKC